MGVYLGKTADIDREAVQRIYDETGALERAMDKMKEFAERGSESLKHFMGTEAKDCLNYLLNQYYMDYIPGKLLEVIV
jgi:geranylgeranyl pyrophosphate synthase